MKISRTVLLASLVLLACGQSTATEILARAPVAVGQIEEWVSPIALYPDPLVALILPATTRPSDIVLAARFVADGGAPDQAAFEPWDDSVKALTRYPEVLTYLDQNLAWARNLGECFQDRPDEVMSAIQAVRARARAGGLLVDTAEQAVVVDGDEICIVPANPTVIYVPRYSPEILYVRSFPFYYSGPFLSFGVGYRVGSWLNFDCDWRYRVIRIAHRPDHWYRQPDWRNRRAEHSNAWSRWVPSPRHERRFDRPAPSAGPGRRPDRIRDQSGPAYGFAPSSRHRETARPATERNAYRPTIAPEFPRATQAPTYQRPSAPAGRQHNSGAYAADPGQNRPPPSGFRPGQGQPSSPPKVSAPPARQTQFEAQARPADSRPGHHDRAPARQREDPDERRQR